MDGYMVELRGISKSFPGVKALKSVSFGIRKGEIHCIIGENGAGKSTLIKILSGAIQKDAGEILFEGKKVEIKNSYEAKRLGIGTVYQEMSLVPSLNAVDNIFLGEEAVRGLTLNRAEMLRRTKEALDTLHVSLNTGRPVRELSTAQQQMIEIARSLVFQRKLIIMDEPTSSLSQRDVSELFRVIRLLKAQGVTIIYISHKMEELKEISDRLTIMRDGAYIETVQFSQVDVPYVISRMVGREFDAERRSVKRPLDGPPVLEVRGLSDYAGRVRDVSFTLPKGIVLGFAGLVGAGRTQLMRLIFGADPIKSGTVTVKGKPFPNPTTEKAVRRGIAYLSEDRKNEGLLLKMPIRQNITVANLEKITRGPMLDKRLEVGLTDKIKDQVRIVASGLDARALSLSGGNQQKVAIAKWLFSDCDILIFDEPTRGIDVGARAEIYTLMNQLVDQGKSVLLVSSDLAEILTMSNLIITMYEGRIMGQMENSEDLTQETIMQQMLGGL